MKDICKFLVDNWQAVLGAILALIGLLITLFKKRPVAWNMSDYVRVIISQFLPIYINDAEVTGMSGERKREHVLAKCMKCLKGFIKCTGKEADSAYETFKNALELILTTPQKK